MHTTYVPGGPRTVYNISTGHWDYNAGYRDPLTAREHREAITALATMRCDDWSCSCVRGVIGVSLLGAGAMPTLLGVCYGFSSVFCDPSYPCSIVGLVTSSIALSFLCCGICEDNPELTVEDRKRYVIMIAASFLMMGINIAALAILAPKCS